MADIKVRHYRRSSVYAGEKELIIETVNDGSETARFLEKMEYRRLERPCYLTLDMRGRVPGECRRHVLNNRIFHLDDTSYGIYQRGLRDNNGVFTVGTYEAIVNGAHTNKGIREAQQAAEAFAAREQEQASGGSGRRQDQDGPVDEAGKDRARRDARLYNPEILPFGYFRKRCEERLQYVTAVELVANGVRYAASTRDISRRGLQVGIKGMHHFAADDRIQLSFTALLEEGGENGILADVAYRVVSMEQREKECLLSLNLLTEPPPEDFAAYIEKLIDRYQRKYKLDVEDDYWSVAAWLYERMYAENMVQIPFFVGANSEGGRFVQSVAVTDGNQPLAQFFRNDVESYDFSALCLPHRIEYLLEHHEMLLVLYRERKDGQYRIHSVADGEIDDPRGHTAFLKFALAHEEHCVVKAMVARIPMHPPSRGKIDTVTARLLERSEHDANDLVASIAELGCLCTLVDVTQQMRDTLPADSDGLVELAGLDCWVGEVCQSVQGGELRRRAEDIQPQSPYVVRFGYVERRREDRYLAETSVELVIGRERLPGKTRDISTRGLCVIPGGKVDLHPGAAVRVGFPVLQKKKKLDISNVAYRVVSVQKHPEVCVMLERVVGSAEYDLNEFFVELIAKNRDKLVLDVAETVSAAASRVYESIAAANLATIPFFLARSEEGGALVQRVAVPEASSALADFFRDDRGEYDFSWLTDSRLVPAVYSQVLELARAANADEQRPPPCEFVMYFYKTEDEHAGGHVIHWANGLEFEDDSAREEFIRTALDSGIYRFLKIMATYTLPEDKQEMERALEQIREQSRHRAFKLQEQLQAVVGCGELVDITEQIAIAYGANAAD